MNAPAQRKVAIVTGASSGIGMETAVALAGEGYWVVLAARRIEKLQEVAARCELAARENGEGGETMIVPTDVAAQSQVQELVDKTLERFGRVDVLVNNAGYGLFSLVTQTSDAEMRRIFDVNYFGAFYGCQAVAPIMMRQRSGHIFNVSSVIGKRGTPFHGAYCATKFALCGLSDSLRVEMKPYHVRVTTVCPALTQTEFFEKSSRGQAAKSSFVKFKSMTPASVVGRKIAATIGSSRPQIVFTLGGKFLALISALWPRLADQMMYVYYKDLAKAMRE
jgi:short-subunit dehydrogenase